MILFDRNEVDVREIHTTDTVVEYKVDTFFQEPIVVEKKKVDTFFVFVGGDKIELPKEQKHYRKENVYDAWVSGYRPSLDSIKTYNRVEYRTVTNDIVRNVYKNTTDIYLECGLNRFSDTFAPELGISISFPKGFKIGANLGYFDNKAFYRINVGYKLNRK